MQTARNKAGSKESLNSGKRPAHEAARHLITRRTTCMSRPPVRTKHPALTCARALQKPPAQQQLALLTLHPRSRDSEPAKLAQG